MWSPKRGWSDWTWGASGDGAPFADAASAMTAAVATSMLDDGAAASGPIVVPAAGDDVTGAGIVQPAPSANITETQLDGTATARPRSMAATLSKRGSIPPALARRLR
jgi:hypothetical protein